MALTGGQDWSKVLGPVPRESEILRRGSLDIKDPQGQRISSAEAVGIYEREQLENPRYCIWKGSKSSNLMAQKHAALQAHDQDPKAQDQDLWFPSPRLMTRILGSPSTPPRLMTRRLLGSPPPGS